jgi:hypothetical protein
MSVLGLDEVKDHLNITRDDNDAKLLSVMDVAEAAVSVRVGPLEPMARTARIPGAAQVLLLPSAPVVSLTSVATSEGVTVSVSDLLLDADAGTIEYASGVRFTASRYDVAYQTGRATLPEDLVLAVMELVRHLWSTQRGAASRPGSVVQEPAAPGFLLPNRVLELLAPYESPRVA